MSSKTSVLVASLGAVVALAVRAPSLPAQGLPGPEVGTFRSDSTLLGYSLDRPEGHGPFPIVVLVHGSGRTTRDEMLNIVPKFTARGFAVFRYDKRGVGVSGGTYRGVNAATSVTVIPELARDAAAAFEKACSSRDIDSKRCGFFGASQAGWIIPEAMRIARDAAFGILFSGVTIPVGKQMFFADIAMKPSVPLDSAYTALPHFDGSRGYDPHDRLAETTVPMLWLLGLQDTALPNRLAILQLDSVRAAGRPITARAFPTYGHSLGPDIWPDIDRFLAPFRAP